MTIPANVARMPIDPTLSIAPNAPPGATPAVSAEDAAAAAQFGAALTIMLGNAAVKAAAQVRAAGESGTPNGDAVEPAADTESGEATSGEAPAGCSAVAGHLAAAMLGEPMHGAASPHTPTPQSIELGTDGLPLAADQSDAATVATPTSKVEAAADTVLDAATQQSLVAAIATPLTITAPIVALPDAAAPADATTVRRDLDLLAPDFRDRLDRVIERMESEFGYKVEVAETYRSQSRQDALFAQGRTEPGQVVTWTRASNHTAGRAADLVIDGSYDDPTAYERLSRVARDEGLRTLGARDPGHIELPSSSVFASVRGSAGEASASSEPSDLRAAVIARPAPSVASQASIGAGISELERRAASTDRAASTVFAPMPDAESELAQQPGVAQVARVAAVSPVAQVATVAQVAQVATVGAQTATVQSAPRTRGNDATGRAAESRRAVGVGAQGPNAGAQPSPIAGLPLSVLNTDAGTDSGTPDGKLASPDEDRRSRSRVDQAAAKDGAAQVLAQAREELMRAVAGTDSSATTSSPSGAREVSGGGIGHADMSERIARLLKVQDAASDRPLSQVMLRLERPDGGEDRLRVDLRGNTVSATIDLGDQATADRMNANVKELQRTLERHGFETDSLTVRTAARPIESSTLARGVGASVETDLQRTVGSSSTTNTNTSSRERGARQDAQQEPSPDSQRQRSRREQRGGRS